MPSTTALDSAVPSRAQWVWDDSERGIVFVGHDTLPTEATFRARASCSRIWQGRTPRSSPSPGCLLADLDITFQDAVDALDQMRFKRHWQRHVKPGEPDVVTLRDIKDVVLFQVQRPLPAEFLKLFHTPPVDRFLRALILYCFFYVQTWEQLMYAGVANANKIREPGLRTSHQEQRESLSCLRALLARDYHNLLLGHGPGITRKFHHMSNGIQSWSQRDARIWELLLRLSVRVTWIAMQRRYLNLIDTEVGRLFRGKAFNSVARKHLSPATNPSKIRRSSLHYSELQEIVLNGVSETDPSRRRTRNTLFSCTPVTSELLSGKHSWALLGLGRLDQPSKSERFRALKNIYTKPEEEIVSVYGMFIGILGMPRANLDVMLTIRDKQRRQETLMSTGSSVGHTYKTLFPVESNPEDNEDTQILEEMPFPFSQE